MRTYLYLSYKCNCNCFFCASDETNIVDNYNEFSFEEAKEFLLSSSNRNALIISGGEPTIHKDFLEIVRFAKQYYESVSLMTNGIKFADMNFLNATIDAGVDKISIPFYSSDKIEHNWMVGNPNAFQKVVQGLSNVNALLLEKPFSVQIKLLLAKFTYKLIPDSIDFLFSNFPNVKQVSLYGFHIGSKALQHQDLCVVSYNESRPYNDLTIQKMMDNNLNFHVCQIPLCAFSIDTIEILLRHNRVLFDGGYYLKRPDKKSRIEESPMYVPEECEICALAEFCPKIYGKNATYFDYGVRPVILQ